MILAILELIATLWLGKNNPDFYYHGDESTLHYKVSTYTDNNNNNNNNSIFPVTWVASTVKLITFVSIVTVTVVDERSNLIYCLYLVIFNYLVSDI